MDFHFPRYLAAKRTVDDRALNRVVWDAMASFLRDCQREPGCTILEVGAGAGSMFQRMVEWGAFWRGAYRAVDRQPENIAAARQEIQLWQVQQRLNISLAGAESVPSLDTGRMIRLELEAGDVFDLIEQEAGRKTWDLLVAHAFLDLFDINALMPGLACLVRPGGMLYLTINFDGDTIFQPVWDQELEDKIIGLYHRTMDERMTDGRVSGDSRAGRHLFQILQENQLEIIAAGSSDWVVYPRQGIYPVDEAYFLHSILHFFEESLALRSELDRARLADWLQRRHTQVERGELVYLAHQLDFLARKLF
jgi:SAM-dependent methyltransferase